MGKQPALLYVFRPGEKVEDVFRYAWLYFMCQYLSPSLIRAGDENDLSPELFTEVELLAVFCHQRKYWDKHHERVVEFVRQNFRPDLPIMIIPDGSPDNEDWLERLADPHVKEFYPGAYDAPSWLLDLVRRDPVIDVASALYELDPNDCRHESKSVYLDGLARLSGMNLDEIKAQCAHSNSNERVGLGSNIGSLLCEPATMHVLASNACGLHGRLWPFLEMTLECYRMLTQGFGITPETSDAISGWIYFKTGTIGLPVLELAASRIDWDDPKTGPMLRRVVAWAHAQCQVIPYLSDGFVPPLAAE